MKHSNGRLLSAFAGLGITAATLPGCTAWQDYQDYREIEKVRSESVRVDTDNINWAAYNGHMKSATGEFEKISQYSRRNNYRYGISALRGGYVSFEHGEGEFPLKIVLLQGSGQNANMWEIYYRQGDAERVVDALQREGSLHPKHRNYEEVQEILGRGHTDAAHDHHIPGRSLD